MKNSRFQSLTLLFITGFLVVTYQNCSVYKSAGLEEFAKELLSLSTGNDCLPYIDVNDAARYMGLGGVDLYTNQVGTSQPDPLSCLFTSKTNTTAPQSKVSCIVTSRSETDPEIMAQLSDDLYANSANAEQILSGYLGSSTYSDFDVFLDDTAEQDYYGYSYTIVDGGIPHRIYKIVGGRMLEGVLDNACAGGACGVCSLVVENSDIGNVNEEALKNILTNFILKITQRQ